MSVIDKLNGVQQARESKYSKALRKSPAEQAAAYAAEAGSPPQPGAVKPQSWVFKGILALLVVLTAAVGVVIVLLLRNSSAGKNEAKPVVTSSQPQAAESKPKTDVDAVAKPKTAVKTKAKRKARTKARPAETSAAIKI
jgi:hypothetical protein